MDHEVEEQQRERAASLEPCSTRPNPFVDTEHPSRKRQRVSAGGSRSSSIDAAQPSTDTSEMSDQRETSTRTDAQTSPPRTPTRPTNTENTTEPTSSRVTINLRTPQALDPQLLDPSTPTPPSPSEPTMASKNGDETSEGHELDSLVDEISTKPTIETPSTSPSNIDSPKIELVIADDDSDVVEQPPLAIIDDEDDDVLIDPILNFPYNPEGETIFSTVKRLIAHFHYETIESDDTFCKLRDWIASYLDFIGSRYDNFYSNYVAYRDFWHELPNVIFSLSSRSRFFGDFLKHNRASRQALSDLMCQFSRLAATFVVMDTRTLLQYNLKEGDGLGPDLGSPPYLNAYSHLVRKDETAHIGRNLELHYKWNWDEDVQLLIHAFQQAGGTVLVLSKLVDRQLIVLPKYPKYIENLTEPCRLVARYVVDASNVLDDQLRSDQNMVEEAHQVIAQGYELFCTMSTALELVIDKHVTILTSDSALSQAASLTSIYSAVLAWEIPATVEMIQEYEKKHPNLPRMHFYRVISYEWKLKLLKRLITSTQMQLRVAGVATMCLDLLHIYGICKGQDPAQSPMLLHFSSFILEHQLVDYIVGVGSHPEIINESYNIVGFLIATKTYQEAQTNIIWQTVLTSQDPRVVEAIIRMMKRCLNLFDYAALIYICMKTSTLPMEAFTATMREFCEHLFVELVAKASAALHVVHAPPYDLCVRLIQESSAITAASPTGNPEIQAFAAGRLHDLLPHGPGVEARNAIYMSCLKDISARTLTAPGSICVINSLLRENMAADLRSLTNDHGLTQLLVGELESNLANDNQSMDLSVIRSPASQARRELMLTIITAEPATISPELGEKLWNLLVGRKPRDSVHTKASWVILNNAVRQASPDNVFIKACYRDYLPKLSPELFTIGALEFAREGVSRWLTKASREPNPETSTFKSLALEQLWHMILSAPSNTIENSAIAIFVDVYTESDLINSFSRVAAREVHSGLIDRCIRQLADAAPKLNILAQESSPESDLQEVEKQEKVFSRSLAVLRDFLVIYQTKPRFATPKSRSPILNASEVIEGDPLTLKYQSFDGNEHTEVKSLTLGKNNTAASLFSSLQKATGFPNYKVYCDGKELDPDQTEVYMSLDQLNLNGHLLVKRHDDGEILEGHASSGKTSLDVEVRGHFEEFYSYLNMQESIAKEIYQFLVRFPAHDKLLEDFDSKTITFSNLFPLGKPYTALYVIYAIPQYVAIKSQQDTEINPALIRAISLIVDTISDEKYLASLLGNEVRELVTLHLVDCFLRLLKEPIPPDPIALNLNEALFHRLLKILEEARASTTHISVRLTCKTFEALLDASLHSKEFWTMLSSHLEESSLLINILVDEPHPVIRKSIGKQISTKCSPSPSPAQVSSTDFIVAFWPIVEKLISAALHAPEYCDETMNLALNVFKKRLEVTFEPLDLEDVVNDWGRQLMGHDCIERFGDPDIVDRIAHGLASLLYCAISVANSYGQDLNTSAFGPKLFQRFLFPDLSEDADGDNEVIVKSNAPPTPLLNQSSRAILTEAVFFLVKDNLQQYEELIAQMAQLVVYDTTDEWPYAYDLNFQNERNKSTRSSTGFVGLRNLSNTCYLNSLFSQLFMNVPFRKFMLNCTIADGTAQKLLAETQTTFSYMQNSFKKFVDPTMLAGSIRTWEETNIDISAQMDVDEFYNLLFDRWESQILAPNAKKEFRSFFGGQLVQQVKSKECPHISEILEPFSAIQCDIKGKSSLQESLQAYVGGEIMEGDNKYKCSTCDRHVDAVKRACLKDVPDNLIFHLKRFDFNVLSLQRSKINDYFSFPTKIDMRPYKVAHLMGKDEETSEDIFELVGILVHSGTAESGHYYSYIRERPSTSEKESWVEFNDDVVSPFDTGNIEGCCFGGADYRGPADPSNIQYDKSYSAYMLFYERSSVLATQKQALLQSGIECPVKLPVPARLASHIAMENELFVRKYCLYDPSYATLVIDMLSNLKDLNAQCSEKHLLERDVLRVSLDHLDQVFTRTKDTPNFQPLMSELKSLYLDCANCCQNFLEWVCDRPEALRQILLRNPDNVVRGEFGMMILDTLAKVKLEAPYAYGLGENEDSDSDADHQSLELLNRVVKGLNKLWEMFHSNCRAWPEYFGLLASIAKLGASESTLLLDYGFLERVLAIINADHNLETSVQYTRMLNIISKRMATRPVSYEKIVELLAILLQTCDLKLQPISDDDGRLPIQMIGGDIPLTIGEHRSITDRWTRGQSNILAGKLIALNQNVPDTYTILSILLHGPADLDRFICASITKGIKRTSSVVSSGVFLKAAIVYCEQSESIDRISEVIYHVARVAGQLDNTDGKDYVQFFKDIYMLPRNWHDIPREDISRFSLHQGPLWMPRLLCYYDPIVRLETEEFINNMILKPVPKEDDDQQADGEQSTDALPLSQRLGLACLEHIHEVYIQQRQQAVRPVLQNICRVVDSCASLFDGDPEDITTRRFLDNRVLVMNQLKRFMVEEAEEEVSEWDGSDGEYGSSEPMDSIAELCGTADSEMIDTNGGSI